MTAAATLLVVVFILSDVRERFARSVYPSLIRNVLKDIEKLCSG